MIGVNTMASKSVRARRIVILPSVWFFRASDFFDSSDPAAGSSTQLGTIRSL
jgi:hypothetical protein